MSVNCIRCGVNKRTGADLLCGDCRHDTSIDAEIIAMKSDPTHNYGEEYLARCIELQAARAERVRLRAIIAGFIHALSQSRIPSAQVEAIGLQPIYDAAVKAIQNNW